MLCADNSRLRGVLRAIFCAKDSNKMPYSLMISPFWGMPADSPGARCSSAEASSSCFEVAERQLMDVVTTINASSIPALLVDARGSLRHANVAGHRALRCQDYLGISGGRIKPIDPKRQHQFSRLLKTVTTNRAEISHGVLRLFDSKGNSAALFLHLLKDYGPQTADYGFCAALFLTTQTRDPKVDALRLRVTFNFTPAEERLVKDLIRGRSLKEAGEDFHLGRETLKSQLSSLFRKTGTHRQGELVAFLLSVIRESL